MKIELKKISVWTVVDDTLKESNNTPTILSAEVWIDDKHAGLMDLIDGEVGGSGRWAEDEPAWVADEVHKLAKAILR